MKRKFLIYITALCVINLSAQNDDEVNHPKLLQKLALDIGAIPISVTTGDHPNLSSYSFVLGYQVVKRLDLRINADVFNLFENESDNLNDYDLYERLIGLSLGVKYSVFKGNKYSFIDRASPKFVGKFGVGISPEYSEHESFFYDFSVRACIGSVPYIGIGINQQLYFSIFKSNLSSFYISFGLDF